MIDFTIQIIAMSMIGACYIPQIYKLIQTKNADSQAISFWVMLSIGLVANVYISYQSALIGGGWSMFVIQVVNSLLAIWTLGLVYKYQKVS